MQADTSKLSAKATESTRGCFTYLLHQGERIEVEDTAENIFRHELRSINRLFTSEEARREFVNNMRNTLLYLEGIGLSREYLREKTFPYLSPKEFQKSLEESDSDEVH